MPLAYFDCQSGISGDMVLGALVDAGVPLDLLNQKIATLGIEGLRLEQAEVKRMGLRGVKIDVRHQPEHKHRHLRDIQRIIEAGELDSIERNLALDIFGRLAEAEAKVHGCAVEKVHFHEVGAVDSIADIVGVAIGLRLFGIESASFSPIPVGCGTVQIAHGKVGLPAPATAELLRGVPLAASDVQAELTTPTGAAIVASIGRQFGGMPSMTVAMLGCGAGTRDLPGQPNILRLFIGPYAPELTTDLVEVLETNVDDVSAEVIANCCEQLRTAGALDVFTTAIMMKKNRAATKVTVLARPADVDRLSSILFLGTRSLGIRRWTARRDKLKRMPLTIETRFGSIAGKILQRPDGQQSFVPEYDACQRAAEQAKVPFIDVYDEAQFQFRAARSDR